MKENPYFPLLFNPAQIGNLKLKNHIVMLPMGISFAGVNGEVTSHTIDYFVERAKGGVGLIELGWVSIDGRISVTRLVLDSDWVQAGHFDLVEAVHAFGTKIGLQLVHPGRQRQPGTLGGQQPVSSSALRTRHYSGALWPVARALEEPEIYAIIDRFVAAALRAKKVGYDLVELHGGHGQLINQFISPYMNIRTDKFGGSLENRMRFPVQLIKGVKEALGDDFPLGMRISAEEFVEGGISIKESPAIAGILAEAGLTYISVSAGIYETEHIGHDGMDKPEGWKMYMWKAIKEAVNIPVIGGGGMKRPSFCEGVLAQGKADLIGLGRPLFADPEWPAKAKNGTVDDIRLCISCWECAAASPAGRQGNARCTVNAAAGREREFSEIKSAAVKKRVMVVGGGPGGMEAARVATLRGHSVTLYEKAPELGGNLLIAAAPPKRDKILWVRDYLATQLKKLKVRIELHTEVTTDLVKRKNPDVVVVATGSKPVAPAIPGIENPNVVSAWDILAGRTEVRNSVVAVIGGSMVGCETADYLGGLGNRVTVVKMRPGEAASDMQPENRVILLERLKKASIGIVSNKEVLEFTQDGVWIQDRDNGTKESIRADWIVLAMGANPVRTLVDSLEEDNVEVYCVGDCEKPRIIKEAIYEGSLAGRKI